MDAGLLGFLQWRMARGSDSAPISTREPRGWSGYRRAVARNSRHARLPTRPLEAYRVYMPMVKQQWTADELLSLPDDGNRYEIIDGELFVTPTPAWRHQDAVGELLALLRDYVRREGVGHAIAADRRSRRANLRALDAGRCASGDSRR